MEILGMNNLIRKLRALPGKVLTKPNAPRESVVVGYTAGYALFVHENADIFPPGMRLAGLPRPKTKAGGDQGSFWDPQGKAQPKFLEGPARELNNSGELRKIVLNAMQGGAKLQEALALAALRIERESQERVPVDTGNLKGSAFVEKE